LSGCFFPAFRDIGSVSASAARYDAQQPSSSDAGCLSRIYHKLSVRSRTELANHLNRLDRAPHHE
jgi:hypothetical protein